MQGLRNKVAVITGAGSGLGREFCLELAAEGVKVVATDVNKPGADETVRMIQEKDGVAISLKMDVTNPSEIKQMVDVTIDQFGSLDILCNNAGMVGELVPLHEVSIESWDRVMNVDLKGVFLVSKFVIPQMLKQKKGVIINVASASAFIASKTGAEYTSAKHGVAGLTKQTAYEYGHKGIRAVAIAPGVIETPLTKEMTKPGGIFHELTMNAPAGRYGRPTDVARLVVFLASEEADFIHGHSIPVDGGSTIL